MLIEPPLPSSQVTNTTVPPAWYSGLAITFGMNAESHASPVATGQSCMSLQRLGVTNVNLAEKSGVDVERHVAAVAQSMFV